MVYLAICLAAAAFQENSKIRGVWLGSLERYEGDVQRYVLWPIFWKSERGLALTASDGVIGGSCGSIEFGSGTGSWTVGL